MKKVLGILSLLLLIGILGIFATSKSMLKPKVVHFHAGFQLYKNGTLQSFSPLQYMHDAPCTLNGKPVAEKGTEQEEKAHLHDSVGDVVHVHRYNATWGDLFTNLKYSIPGSAVGYINGQKVSNFLQTRIRSYDSLVILIDTSGDVQKYLKSAITKQHIRDIEKRSETCGATSS